MTFKNCKLFLLEKLMVHSQKSKVLQYAKVPILYIQEIIQLKEIIPTINLQINNNLSLEHANMLGEFFLRCRNFLTKNYTYILLVTFFIDSQIASALSSGDLTSSKSESSVSTSDRDDGELFKPTEVKLRLEF